MIVKNINNKDYQEFDIVMLPTNAIYVEKGQIYSNGGDLGINNNKSLSYIDFIPQHLYILSDDEIKEGDWLYYITPHGKILIKKVIRLLYPEGEKSIKLGEPATRMVIKGTKKELFSQDMIFPSRRLGGTDYASDIIESEIIIKECNTWKKIISTTDESLIIFLPQPSQSFIEHYITEYNKKGNLIRKVMVEVEYLQTMDENGEYFIQLVIQNNIINILIENYFSKEEKETIKRFLNQYEKNLAISVLLSDL